MKNFVKLEQIHTEDLEQVQAGAVAIYGIWPWPRPLPLYGVRPLYGIVPVVD